LFAFTIMASTSHSQMLNFTFEISEEVFNDLVHAQDQVEDLKAISPYGYSNMSFRFSEADSDKSSYWQDVYAEFYSPAPGGQKRIAKVRVDANQAFYSIDKTKKLKIEAKLNTAFKNRIWTEREIPAGRYNENIVLDEYNRTADDMMSPEKVSGLIINLEQPWAADRHNFFTEELAANNDSLMRFQEGKFHVQVKNEGDDVWKADFYPNNEPMSTYRAVDIQMRKYDFDFSKSFVFRISVKTRNENYLWRELKLEPNQLSAEIIADQYYTGAEFDSLTSARNDISEPIVEEVEESNVEETNTNTNSNEAETQTNESEPVQDETNTTPAFVCTPGDTTMRSFSVYNEKICVKDFKYNVKGNVQGQLTDNFDVTINGTNVPLKGGTKIVLDESKKIVVSSVLLESTPFKQDGADFVMKADSKVELSKAGLTGVDIEGEGALELKGVSFGCRPQDGSKGFDIQFDNKGRIQEFTSTTQATWNVNTDITIPAGSRVGLKNGKLKNILMLESTEITLNGKTYKVVPGKKASLIFDSNEALESFIIGSDHSIDVNGQFIPIQTNSKVKVAYNGSAYSISTIVVASKVTVTVVKKGKSKEVDVKPGKKIVIENGVIVKAG